MGFISHYITPLIINSLGGGHTHTHSSIQTFADRSNTRKPAAHAWFKNLVLYAWPHKDSVLDSHIFIYMNMTREVASQICLSINVPRLLLGYIVRRLDNNYTTKY